MVSEVAERSIAGQIEYWAQLGKAIEPLLRSGKAMALRRGALALPLSQVLASVDSEEGRSRLQEHLAELPYPHYEPAEQPGWIVRIDEDGSRSTGRFVNRKFVAAG